MKDPGMRKLPQAPDGWYYARDRFGCWWTRWPGRTDWKPLERHVADTMIELRASKPRHPRESWYDWLERVAIRRAM